MYLEQKFRERFSDTGLMAIITEEYTTLEGVFSVGSAVISDDENHGIAVGGV